MRREPSWLDLGRTAAKLLKSLDPDLRGCSDGTDVNRRKPTGRKPSWPATPGRPVRWPGRR
jgi:hypothetical protein